MDAEIEVEVVCALPERQPLLRVRVPPGCTAREAVERSGIAAMVPEVDVDRAPLGVFGRVLEDPAGYELVAGDRVEIYRELAQDPRAARRRRVR
jgi:putative ubiquitin-RnfH superfamily antitoxin RatB of RatAB toxin-antitoxin module